MGQKLLATHMNDENKTKVISETLNTKFYHHGYPLARTEAKDIGLAIAEPNEKIENLMWNIYEDFMEELQFNNIFNPESMIMEKISNKPQPTPNVINSIKEKIKLACVESSNANCYIEEELVATYMMLPDTSLNTNIMVNPGNWIIEEGEMEMNNITTSGLIIANTSRNVKIESKKIVSQCVPYFFQP